MNMDSNIFSLLGGFTPVGAEVPHAGSLGPETSISMGVVRQCCIDPSVCMIACSVLL